jgi:hypothetical protein
MVWKMILRKLKASNDIVDLDVLFYSCLLRCTNIFTPLSVADLYRTSIEPCALILQV